MADEGEPIGSTVGHHPKFLSDATFGQLITDLDVEDVKRLNEYQDPFGSAGLNVVRSKNLSEVNRSATAHLVILSPGRENLRETHLPLW